MNKSDLLIFLLTICFILDLAFVFLYKKYFSSKNRLGVRILKLTILVVGSVSAWLLLFNLPQLSEILDYFFSAALFYFIVIRIVIMGGVK